MQPACSESEDSFDFLFKIILVGDSDVGKTCLVQSFKSGIFMEKQQNTIGVDFTVRTMDIDGKKVKVGVQLVMFPDIIQCRSGTRPDRSASRTITQSYYRSAHGAMVAYDISRRSTFESVPHWIREVQQYGAASVVLVLAGNKSDLHLKRQVLFEDACTLAENNSVLAALETSAMEAQNVEAAFILMARELMARNGAAMAAEDAPQSALPLKGSTLPIHVSPPPDKKCGCRAS
ncbi:Ras-related protein Rab-19 [Oryzias melastigma]|uniref:Ras-related protein Rab-19 n=1 Tax=Oryzias melastigma TaxID=30732 RepID=A0A834C0J7_ORYME|nr:Ras-related protein Rab-19 [Oryzias melastigma]